MMLLSIALTLVREMQLFKCTGMMDNEPKKEY